MSVNPETGPEAATARADRALRLAGAIHDLRQPLHAIGLFASGLRPHVAAAEGGPILDRIEAALAAMEAQVGGLLEWARLDGGLVQPRPARVCLTRLLGRLLEACEAEAAAKGLALRAHPLPVFVRADPLLLERMLQILLGRALRHTRRGGVLIGARRRGARLRLEIWDTGGGLDAEGLALPGGQARGASARSGREALELAALGQMGRLTGHALQVRSRPGRGSVVMLEAPLDGPEGVG